jgi:hypothetical protein
MALIGLDKPSEYFGKFSIQAVKKKVLWLFLSSDLFAQRHLSGVPVG